MFSLVLTTNTITCMQRRYMNSFVSTNQDFMFWNNKNLHLFLRYCMQYHVMLGLVITAPECIYVRYISFIEIKVVWVSRNFPRGREGPILLTQSHGCWWPGHERSQLISSHGVDLSCREYFDLSTRRLHNEAETKWPPFSWRHFQMHFPDRKCLYLDEDFTVIWSQRSN